MYLREHFFPKKFPQSDKPCCPVKQWQMCPKAEQIPQQVLFKTKENFHLQFHSLQLTILRIKPEKKMLAFYCILQNGHQSLAQDYTLNLRKKNDSQRLTTQDLGRNWHIYFLQAVCGKWWIIAQNPKASYSNQGAKMSGKSRHTFVTDWLPVLPLASSPLKTLSHRSNQWWNLFLFSNQVQSSIS